MNYVFLICASVGMLGLIYWASDMKRPKPPTKPEPLRFFLPKIHRRVVREYGRLCPAHMVEELQTKSTTGQVVLIDVGGCTKCKNKN